VARRRRRRLRTRQLQQQRQPLATITGTCRCAVCCVCVYGVGAAHCARAVRIHPCACGWRPDACVVADGTPITKGVCSPEAAAAGQHAQVRGRDRRVPAVHRQRRGGAAGDAGRSGQLWLHAAAVPRRGRRAANRHGADMGGEQGATRALLGRVRRAWSVGARVPRQLGHARRCSMHVRTVPHTRTPRTPRTPPPPPHK
jgi:hypothetical protein